MEILRNEKGQFLKGRNFFLINNIYSAESRKKQRESLKKRYANGLKVWNKGKKGICKSNSGSFKKGMSPWNKNKTNIYSKKTLEKMSKNMISRIGINSANWKGGVSRAYKTGYFSMEYKQWRKKVFERDNFTCQMCKTKETPSNYVTAHHIKSFAKYPKLRFEVSNGITLCEDCHCKVDKYRKRFRKKDKLNVSI